jgi:hypothetical protein
VFVDNEANADGKSLGQNRDDHSAHPHRIEGPARKKVRVLAFGE